MHQAMNTALNKYLPLIIGLALTVIFLRISFLQVDASGILFAEDQAFTFSVAQQIRDGHFPLLGPPSHIGGRHLGAFFYFIAAGCLELAGGDLVVAARIFSGLNLLSIALLALLVQKIVPPQWQWWSIAITLAFATSGNLVQILRIPWHSHLLFLISMVFLWTAYGLFTQGISRLPLFLLGSTLVTHLHFSAIPLVAAFCLVWLYTLRTPEQRAIERANAKELLSPGPLLALLTTIALWVPLAWHDLTYSQNTILDILTRTGSQKAHAGILRAFANAGYFFRLNIMGGPGFKELWNDSRVSIYLLLTLSSLGFFIRGRSAIRPESRTFVAALLVALALYTLATSRQPAPLQTYYLYPILALPFIFGAVAMLGMISSLKRGWAEKLFTIGIGIIWLSTLRFGVYYFERDAHTGGISRYTSLLHVVEMGEVLRAESAKLPTGGAHTVLGRGELGIMKDTYLGQLGPNYYGQMHYAETMRELPAFQTPSSSPYAFAIVCPDPPQHHLNAMWQELRATWRELSEVDLTECTTCRRCRMWVLERKPPSSS